MKFLTAIKNLKHLLLVAICLMTGCAAFRPIDGVPARYLAPELRAQSRSNESTIDLSLLAQKPPRQHYVDSRDVLGIYIEGILGRVGEPPPINNPTSPDLAPSVGYPFTVRDDGTLSLPEIGSFNVRGMTIRQIEEKIRRLYTEKKILKEGADRIIVSLQRPRQVRILVLRQETGGPGGTEFAQGLSLNLGQSKRGNGQVVHLPIYKNDVLHALARTGGLPGLDAENTIYIIRREHSTPAGYGQYQPLPVMPNSPQGYSPVPGNQPLNQPWQNGQAPVSARNFSAIPKPKNPGIQLVGYHPNSQNGSRIEQVSAFRTSASPQSRSRFEAPSQFNHAPLATGFTSNRSAQQGSPNPFGNQFTARSTIAPAAARSFGNTNPLAELRTGMQSTYQAPADFFANANQPQPIEIQREVILEQPAPSSFTQLQYNQPAPQAPTSHLFKPQATATGDNFAPPVPGSTYQAPMQAPYQTPPTYAPTTNYSPAPQANFGSNISPYGGHDQFYSDVDMGMNNYQEDPTMNNQKVIKIPIRLKPGEQPNVRMQDIILKDGDIVFIESRETEIFYTGGLLGGGQYTLPRDYDLDVLGAIAIAQGSSQQQSVRQLGGASALNGDVTISASSVIILRRLPNGSQVPIKVDLYRALTDPSERILIQPGDMVMLRYKVHEAIGAFFERNFLESALFGVAASQLTSGGN